MLAGEVDGIFTADPLQHPDAARIDLITPANFASNRAGLGGSHGVDVTGGMRSKVEQSLQMVRRHPQLAIVVCSGLAPMTFAAALAGERVGTRITV